MAVLCLPTTVLCLCKSRAIGDAPDAAADVTGRDDRTLELVRRCQPQAGTGCDAADRRGAGSGVPESFRLGPSVFHRERQYTAAGR